MRLVLVASVLALSIHWLKYRWCEGARELKKARACGSSVRHSINSGDSCKGVLSSCNCTFSMAPLRFLMPLRMSALMAMMKLPPPWGSKDTPLMAWLSSFPFTRKPFFQPGFSCSAMSGGMRMYVQPVLSPCSANCNMVVVNLTKQG